MGTVKNTNGVDLTEAEEIKWWQEYTGELYKNDPYNHNDVITHLEPDILECGVKWALGSITTKKASGDGGNPVDFFQILKDMKSVFSQWKDSESAALIMPANMETSTVPTGL